MKHLEFRKLVDFFEGRLPEGEYTKVAAHVEGCAECSAASSKLENFFRYVSGRGHARVPQSTTANLLNIFTPPRKPHPRPSFYEVLKPLLVFDDWSLASNERIAYSDTRQQFYNAGKHSIDLRFNFTGDKCQVAGQVFTECSEGFVELTSSEESSEIDIKVDLDDTCEFVLPIVEQGNYKLAFRISDSIIEFGEIDLKA